MTLNEATSLLTDGRVLVRRHPESADRSLLCHGGDRVSATEIRQLVALVAVADEGSFTRAALRLGYSQSAISHQIATLERLVGRKLVQRPAGSRSLRLTEAGERFHDHAREIITRVTAAHADLEAADSVTSGGILRLGSDQTASTRILPRVLPRLVEAMPQTRIRLTESSDPADLTKAVADGSLDATFALSPLPAGPFSWVELTRDDFVLIAAPDAPFAERRDPLGLDEIAALPLIGWPLRSERGPQAQLQARGYDPDIVTRSDDIATVQALVAVGVGFAVVPRLSVESSDAVAALDIEEGLADRIMVLAWHRDRPAHQVLARFVDLVRGVAQTA